MIDNSPETMLMIEPGTKNGEIRRTPRAAYSSLCLLDHRQSADARADDHPDPVGIVLGHFEAAVAKCLDAAATP